MPAIDNNTLRSLLDKDPTKGTVESRCVASLDYEDGDLTIEFHQRGTYRYFNFPLEEFVAFATSFSLGTYFNLYIKDAGYAYEKVG